MIDTDKKYTILDETFSRELAGLLLDINAVLLRPNDPFTWSSGWNSPIYCDNRLTLRYPAIRKKIAQELISIIENELERPDVITGTATAGIPHAAWVAGSMDLPLAYVRAKAKAYGLGNQIEGGVDKGQSTIVIEDLISTGGSVISVVEALKFIGANTSAILSIFTYGFDKANKKIAAHNIPVYTLTDYNTLIDVAVEKGAVQSDDIKLLNSWRANPEKWPN